VKTYAINTTLHAHKCTTNGLLFQLFFNFNSQVINVTIYFILFVNILAKWFLEIPRFVCTTYYSPYCHVLHSSRIRQRVYISLALLEKACLSYIEKAQIYFEVKSQ
jgi:hypothetical protein